MTPEDWAERVEIVVDEVGDPRDPSRYVNYERTLENITDAIRQAVAAERARCAAIVRDSIPNWPDRI